MENASKNAEEMIAKLQMSVSAHSVVVKLGHGFGRLTFPLLRQFNRMRQAAITNELVDIITGASGALSLLLSTLSSAQRADLLAFPPHTTAL
jgi:hypothetical protein